MFHYFVLVILCLSSLTQFCSGDGHISVRLTKFSSGGVWCDWSSKCDIQMTFCMGDLHGPSATDICPYGSITAGHIPDTDEIVYQHTIDGKKANPMEFAFKTWPGGLKLKIDLNDVDDGALDDMDYMSLKIPDRPLEAGSNVTKDVALSGAKGMKLWLTYQVSCDQGFYGYQCDCQPENSDHHGHYTCGQDGKKECRPGWEGVDCKANVNDCASSPCFNGAVCLDGHRRFTCKCSPGFAGRKCKIKIHNCARSPCENGGSCFNTAKGYICKCKLGFSGKQCELRQKACEPGPCLNGGVCKQNDVCSCPEGYVGPQCENRQSTTFAAPTVHVVWSTSTDRLLEVSSARSVLPARGAPTRKEPLRLWMSTTKRATPRSKVTPATKHPSVMVTKKSKDVPTTPHARLPSEVATSEHFETVTPDYKTTIVPRSYPMKTDGQIPAHLTTEATTFEQRENLGTSPVERMNKGTRTEYSTVRLTSQHTTEGITTGTVKLHRRPTTEPRKPSTEVPHNGPTTETASTSILALSSRAATSKIEANVGTSYSGSDSHGSTPSTVDSSTDENPRPEMTLKEDAPPTAEFATEDIKTSLFQDDLSTLEDFSTASWQHEGTLGSEPMTTKDFVSTTPSVNSRTGQNMTKTGTISATESSLQSDAAKGDISTVSSVNSEAGQVTTSTSSLKSSLPSPSTSQEVAPEVPVTLAKDISPNITKPTLPTGAATEPTQLGFSDTLTDTTGTLEPSPTAGDDSEVGRTKETDEMSSTTDGYVETYAPSVVASGTVDTKTYNVTTQQSTEGSSRSEAPGQTESGFSEKTAREDVLRSTLPITTYESEAPTASPLRVISVTVVSSTSEDDSKGSERQTVPSTTPQVSRGAEETHPTKTTSNNILSSSAPYFNRASKRSSAPPHAQRTFTTSTTAGGLDIAKATRVPAKPDTTTLTGAVEPDYLNAIVEAVTPPGVIKPRPPFAVIQPTMSEKSTTQSPSSESQSVPTSRANDAETTQAKEATDYIAGSTPSTKTIVVKPSKELPTAKFYMTGKLNMVKTAEVLVGLEHAFTFILSENTTVSDWRMESAYGENGELLTEFSFSLLLANGTVLLARQTQALLDVTIATGLLTVPLPIYTGKVRLMTAPGVGTSTTVKPAGKNWWSDNWVVISIGGSIIAIISVIIILHLARRRRRQRKEKRRKKDRALLHKNKAYTRDQDESDLGMFNGAYIVDKTAEGLLPDGSPGSQDEKPSSASSADDYQYITLASDHSVVATKGGEAKGKPDQILDYEVVVDDQQKRDTPFSYRL